MSAFKMWTCVFPGKMGLCWKLAWNGSGTKEEAETEAQKFCNSVVVPLQLWEKIKEHDERLVKAEEKVRQYEKESNESTELINIAFASEEHEAAYQAGLRAGIIMTRDQFRLVLSCNKLEGKYMFINKIMKVANDIYNLDGCCHWETITENMLAEHNLVTSMRELLND